MGQIVAWLLFPLTGQPISRAADQPSGGGGNRYVFDAGRRILLRGWQPIGVAAGGSGG